MMVGYARVSTKDQSLDIQTDELTKHGCERLFTDKATGTTTDRDGLNELLSFVRHGDTIVVSRLDRFARSLPDLFKMLDQLATKGVNFQCLHQSIDTSSSTGKLTLAVLGAVAEFENDLRKERQREGIEKAKAKGVYKGRQATIDVDTIRRLKGDGLGASAIAREMGINRSTVYKLLKQQENG